MKLKKVVDLNQLKTWGCLNKKNFKLLNKSLEKKKKVLILATKNAGKNTVQHAIVNHYHKLLKDPFVVPPIEGIPIRSFNRNKKVVQLKKMISNFKSYVVAIQHTGMARSNIEEMANYFLTDFDLIIDLRNVKKNERVVYNLIGHL